MRSLQKSHDTVVNMQAARAEAEGATLQARCEHLTHALSSLEDTQGQATDVLQTAEQQIAMFDAKCGHLEDEWQAAATKRCAVTRRGLAEHGTCYDSRFGLNRCACRDELQELLAATRAALERAKADASERGDAAGEALAAQTRRASDLQVELSDAQDSARSLDAEVAALRAAARERQTSYDERLQAVLEQAGRADAQVAELAVRPLRL